MIHRSARYRCMSLRDFRLGTHALRDTARRREEDVQKRTSCRGFLRFLECFFHLTCYLPFAENSAIEPCSNPEQVPHGIAIGHWPEVSGQYTFEGVICEVWVYKYDPAAAAQGLLDTCCGDYRSALDSTAETLRSMGYTKEKARAQGLELMKFGLATAARVRGTDPVRSKQQATLSAQALAAFQRGDSAAYTTAFTQLAEMAATTLAPADQQQIHAEMEQLVKALPLPIKHWQALIGKMCWGKAKIDPKMVYHSVEQMLAKKTPKSAKAGRN